MVLNNDCVCDNADHPLETLGLTGGSMAQQPASGRRPLAAHTDNPRDDNGPDERMVGDEPPQENPLPKGGDGTGVPPGGGGEADQGSRDDEEMGENNP